MFYAILMIALASVLFGIVPSGNNYILLSGMAPGCLLFWQMLTMTAVSGAVMKIRRIRLCLCRKDVIRLAIIGLVGIGATDYLLNMAYKHLPVSAATMLHFVYPAMVLLVSVVFFHRRLSIFSVGALLFSLLGLYLAAGLKGHTLNLPGILFALGSAAAYTFFVIANDHGDVNRLPLIEKLFVMSFACMIFYAGEMIWRGEGTLPRDAFTAVILFGLVGIGTLIGFYLITAGIARIGADRAAFLNVLEPLVGTLGGVLIYGEKISRQAMIGCGCILISILLIAADGKAATRVK